MYNTWPPYLYLSLFLGVILIGEFAYHKLKIKTEHTRKLIHIGSGLLVLFFPYVVLQPLLAIAFCLSFLIVIYLSDYYNFFPSIHDIERSSYGAFLLPFVFLLSYLIYYYSQDYIFFYLPILILAISDALAALIGQKWPYRPYEFLSTKKTISGSFAFFLSAFFLSLFCLIYFEKLSLSYTLIIALSISLTTTVTEAVSGKGYDNINIPFMVVLNIYLFKEFLTVF